MIVLCFSFVAESALYIYGINEAAVHTIGVEAGIRNMTLAEEDLHILEVERAHLAVGSWLEEHARQYNLSAAGAVYFLLSDTAVARIDN